MKTLFAPKMVLSPLLIFLGICSATPPAQGEDAGRPIHYGHDYVILDSGPCEPSLVPLVSDYTLKIFLNFEGETLTPGGNDSRTNTTDLVLTSALDYPAMNWSRMGGKEQGMAAVLEELRLLFMDFSVEFVTTRPESGDYTMAMVGGRGENCEKGSVDTVGIAPLDCKNSNKNDIVLIYGELIEGSAKTLAYVIAHELGHSFGLEHVVDETSIMHPAQVSSTCTWTDSELSEASSCGRSSQDDHQVLIDNLGGGPGDTVEPQVWFLHPGPGAVVPPDFSVEVAAADDLRVHHVEILLDGEVVATKEAAPYAVSLSGLSQGSHRIQARVYDWKPNEVTAEVTVEVDSGCISRGTCFLGQAGLGATCSDAAQCASGVCAEKAGQGQCVASCSPDTDICPAGLSCQQHGEDWACTADEGWALSFAESGGGGGGCQLGGPRFTGSGSWLWAWLLAGAYLAFRRRRRVPGSL